MQVPFLLSSQRLDREATPTFRSVLGTFSASFHEILAKVREVDSLVAEVANASEEQSGGLSQISSSVGQIDKQTQTNAAGASQTASAAGTLKGQSEALRQVASQLISMVTSATIPKPVTKYPARTEENPVSSKLARSALTKATSVKSKVVSSTRESADFFA